MAINVNPNTWMPAPVSTPSYAPVRSGRSIAGGAAGAAAGGFMAGGPAGAAMAAGGQIASALLGNKGAKRASKAQESARREAMEYQRQQDEKEEARFREQEAKLEAQWLAREAEDAPYRQAAESLLGQNAGRLGLQFTPSSRPTSRPTGWTPTSTPSRPRTLSSLAGNSPGVYDVPAIEAPKMSLSDVINSSWGARS